MRILVVEDEKKIASMIERGLKAHKYAVDIAYDGEEGQYQAEINPYDLIILDRMLPKKDGLTVCRDLRKNQISTPILMLTARSTVKDRVAGLNSGADDYLCKPFSFDELLARSRALLRRQRDQKIDQLSVADLEVNLQNHETVRAGQKLDLTNKEFALLEYLLLNEGQVVTRTMISEHVWNEEFDPMTNVIDVHIRYLRKKIDDGFDQKLIHTIRGTGYTLEAKES